MRQAGSSVTIARNQAVRLVPSVAVTRVNEGSSVWLVPGTTKKRTDGSIA